MNNLTLHLLNYAPLSVCQFNPLDTQKSVKKLWRSLAQLILELPLHVPPPSNINTKIKCHQCGQYQAEIYKDMERLRAWK